MSDEMNTESAVAQKYRDEALASLATANQYRAAAEKDRQAAEYERGQVEHRLRTIQAAEAGISAREKWLREHGEQVMLEREAAAAAQLAQAQELMADYDRDKHRARKAIVELNEREAAEKAAREAAARRKPAAA